MHNVQCRRLTHICLLGMTTTLPPSHLGRTDFIHLNLRNTFIVLNFWFIMPNCGARANLFSTPFLFVDPKSLQPFAVLLLALFSPFCSMSFEFMRSLNFLLSCNFCLFSLIPISWKPLFTSVRQYITLSFIILTFPFFSFTQKTSVFTTDTPIHCIEHLKKSKNYIT